MRISKNVVTMMILLMMGTCLCACGGSGQAAERENTSGILQMGCFYEDNIITLSAPERFMYSEWEPAGFEYICTDPTCSHLSDSCSALTFHETGVYAKHLCVAYQDRLVILDSYAEHVDHGTHVADGVTNLDVSHVWHTDVYEADLDGRNRKCKLSFAGSIGSADLIFAAVMEEGVLYFGGPIESRIIMEYDDTGAVSRNEVIHSDAFYALDLEDYSVKTFAEAEGKDSMSYSYYVGTQEEREVLAVEQDRDFLVAAVMEDQIWVMTDYSMEKGSTMTEYTVLNAEDDVVGLYHYDDYILFYGVVGDRLIYSKNMFSNEEMWWADKSDIADLAERGVYIGHVEGRYNDILSFGAD